MRLTNSTRLLAFLVVGLATLPLQAETIEGTVLSSQSRWAFEGTSIVTESTIRTANGDTKMVRQLGGSVGGIGMRVIHGQTLIRPGDRVSLRTTKATVHSGDAVHPVQEVLTVFPGTVSESTASETSSKKREPFDRQEFVQTRNKSETTVYWRSNCVFVTPAIEGTKVLVGGLEFDIVQSTLTEWEAKTRHCSNFQLHYREPEAHEVGLDGINIIKFREHRWCRPATRTEQEECYDKAAAGLTTLFFVDDPDSSRNGEILDADIELNGVNFAISANGVSSNPQSCAADLANTLTHELGHLLGLDHTCWVKGPRLTDGDGQEVPACSGTTDSKVTEATMYTFQDCGETKKASLEADDAAGMCTIYPTVSAPTCEEVILDAGCCTVATSRKNNHGSKWLGGLFVALTFGLARRRRKAYETNL